MASIVKKRIKGRSYYYARESRRVDGRPKIVWQKYLGTAETLIRSVDQAAVPATPKEVEISDFGAVAALYDVASRLRVVEIIDRHAPKRNQGPSVGAYMLLAAINRCVCPKSKAKMGQWFVETPLRRWIAADRRSLSSQRFWDNMGLLSAEAIRGVEDDLARILVEEFGVDVRGLLYDTTNFFTFIDSFNDASTLAQRGHSKEGRANLRIVGLALMVSMDFHVPLFHESYPGNVTDSTQFASVTERLVARHRQLSRTVEDITLVIDKGNNSEANVQALDKTPFHFVGSLQVTQVPDLMQMPRRSFRPLQHPRLSGVTAYRTTREVFGCPRTVVVTFNDQLFLTQSQSLFREAQKRLKQLGQLRATLLERTSGKVRGGRRPTVAGVRKKAKDILRGQHLQELIQVKVARRGEYPVLDCWFDPDAFRVLSEQRLGKTVLFTDRDDWTNEEIVLAYRGQAGVEKAFETMKNPHFVSWSPMFHWTDDKVRVHAFYCVLALTLVSLLQRELHQKGVDISIPAAMEELGRIREVALTYEHPGRVQTSPPRLVVSKMSPLQQKLYETLNLARYHEQVEAEKLGPQS